MKKSFRAMKNLGRKPIGTWADGTSPLIIELAGYTGFDFVIIDNEHGCGNQPSFLELIRTAEAADIAPIFRVPGASNEDMIKKVLDSGASGVLVPNVCNKQDAQLSVRYAKYAPIGNRGACPYLRNNRYSLQYGTVDFYEKSNAEVAVILLIENVEAVKNFDEIISVPGVDAILFGRVDLSVSMGIPGQLDHPRLVAAIEDMLAKAAAKGIFTGMVGFGDEDTRSWFKNPQIDFITNGGDSGAIIASNQKFLAFIQS